MNNTLRSKASCFDTPTMKVPLHAGRTGYASPSGFEVQVCFSKSSCATRLNASAATVLSRRGVVIPHVQREQHHPLKSSPSTQMRRLLIEVHLLFGIAGLLHCRWGTPLGRELVRLISHGSRGEPSIEGASRRN